MAQHRFTRTALSAALLSLCVAVGASAQTAATSPSPGTSAAPAATAPAAKADTTRATKSAEGKLSRSDRKFVEKAAKGGMAEVELGKLAEQHAQSDEVKNFAKKMVDDHSKANDELKKIASSKGVTLPTEVDRSERREMDKLAKRSGADFDREYMKHMVSDHKKDVKEFKSESKSKDGDLANFASSTLPTLEQHLQLAQSTEQTVRKEGKSAPARTSSNTGGTATAPPTGSAAGTTPGTPSSGTTSAPAK